MTTPPTVLGGRYELGQMIGQGGMATVFTGRDIRLGRTVAIKLLRSDLVDDKTFAARFRQEAFAVASLNHPRVVGIYDTGEQQINGMQIPYIVMEYVDGKPLNEIQDENLRILPERAMEITAEVLDALEYSHRAGIIHRDIKPGNVMITPGGEVKVMDFGIARAVDSATMTATRTVVGTANYLSPEQARGETVDHRSDVYSTGCLLHELLTGRPPFTADSPIAVIYQHVGEEPRPPGVRPDIDAVVLDALAKDTGARYQSAAEMRSDLLRVLDGQPPLGPSSMRGGDSGRMAAAGPGGATRPIGPGGPRGPGGPPPTGEQPTGSLPTAEEEGRGRRKKAILIAGSAAALALIVVGAFALPGLTGNEEPNKPGGSDSSPTPSETVRKNEQDDDRPSPRDDGAEDEIDDDWSPPPEEDEEPEPEPTTPPPDEDDDTPTPSPSPEPTTPPDEDTPEPTDEPTEDTEG